MDDNQVLAIIVIDVCYIMLGLNNNLCVGYVISIIVQELGKFQDITYGSCWSNTGIGWFL